MPTGHHSNLAMHLFFYPVLQSYLLSLSQWLYVKLGHRGLQTLILKPGGWFYSQQHLQFTVQKIPYLNVWVAPEMSSDWTLSVTCSPGPAHPLVCRLRSATKLQPPTQVNDTCGQNDTKSSTRPNFFILYQRPTKKAANL